VHACNTTAIDGSQFLAKQNSFIFSDTALSQPATGPSIACQGSDVTLQCVILRNGVPVDLQWRRNGTVIDTNILTNHQLVFNSTYNAVTDLMITNVSLEDDNTEYSCSTAATDITSSIVLKVAGE